MTPLRHVLLIRTDHLGDMLLTLPMASAIKGAWPQCRVSVLASRANAVAAQHHPDVDHVEIDTHEAKGSGLRGVRALARRLAALHCDAAVVVHPTPRLALAAWLSRIPLRVGSASRAYSWLFNRRVQQRRRGSTQHESSLNLAMLSALGLAGLAARGLEDLVRWRVDAAETAAIDALLAQTRVQQPFVVLHPGNAGSAMNWSPQQYAELGKRLAAAGTAIVVSGGPDETQLSSSVARAIGAAAVDLGGQTSLPQLAALLQRAAMYVGSATGPTHLAAAVGVPVLALYSPLRSSAPARWRPLGQKVHLLQPQLELQCPRCLGERCPYWHCMQRHLPVEQVERAARLILAAEPR